MAVTGNQAVAEALRQINPDVVPAYPITPSTDIVQRFSEFVNNGEVDTEMILVESEHSAMSAAIGASAAGGRVATATSSQGMALMWEMLFIASGYRLPIFMALVNRALSAPLNIHGDHSDGMGMRDSGWIQLWSENAQEAYDNMVMAPRIAEHMDVRLPIIVCLDGFIISHSIESMKYLPDEEVKKFVGEFAQLNPLLDTDNPKSIGALVLPDYYMEHKRAQHEAMLKVKKVVQDVSAEFAKLSGRKYEIFETYRLEDAEVVLVSLNSAAGTIKDEIDRYRDKGIKAGLLKPRLFRPFPYEEVGAALKNAKAVCVMDRADSFGGYGPMFMEIASALYPHKGPVLFNKIYGLGGRDLMPLDVDQVIDETVEVAKTGKVKMVKEYITVRN
ncbi:MAG: pyruvate ferredoxin oxidoreductase [Nitrospirae bacterium GWC2_57_13]|nr:MAG: pyruvate ferredoxin oxidoreductase [Nitrospirae bacterium GWC1_57_7]OGW29941.1 MAG: pyruvate ferredoxin oxidoreductase [Nitrospirae bacterium GWC2_57_13]OGW42573.1 MAG: pyruvate ferredoxin oxidoreductase [Nitrospirae bacterium GWD2_57_8]